MQKRDEKIALVEGALQALYEDNRECRLCPRACYVKRHQGETGFCGVANAPLVSSYCLHFGEEPCLSGYYDFKDDVRTGSALSGSGAVFFSGCNLKCVFCQNYQISRHVHGSPVSPERLAGIFLSLQQKKALNINLVTPSHVILPILEALKQAFSLGLTIPVVYNSGGYESCETIRKLAGIVDIYLPDFKYIKKTTALRLSSAPDYPQRVREVIQEMHRQVGYLEIDDEGTAKRGLIIRHLILPGHSEESCEILEWIASRLSTRVCLSLMSQYYPCSNVPDTINRGILKEEYEKVLTRAKKLGFEDVYIQTYPFKPEDHLAPDFERKNPFLWDETL